MTASVETAEDLRVAYDELRTAYQVMKAAIPLALQRLHRGGVSAIVQLDFWTAIKSMEQFGDVIDYSTLAGELDAVQVDRRIDQLTGETDRH